MASLQSTCKSSALKWTASLVVQKCGLCQLAAFSYQGYKQQSLACIGPAVWNSLPVTLLDSSVSTTHIRAATRTYLFAASTPSGTFVASLRVWRSYVRLRTYLLTNLLTYRRGQRFKLGYCLQCNGMCSDVIKIIFARPRPFVAVLGTAG